MIELSDKQIAKIKNDIPKKIGNHLRDMRISKQISQTDLANSTGKDRQYIYKIEKGIVTINVATLFAILTVLEITFEDFFKDFEQES
jgi:transcriptional regulator with XRE-family HTH domain